jgi:hypothetical protein
VFSKVLRPKEVKGVTEVAQLVPTLNGALSRDLRDKSCFMALGRSPQPSDWDPAQFWELRRHISLFYSEILCEH